jgi:serine/threonine protein kinase
MGLHYLHLLDIVHRDLNLGNFLIFPGFVTKICDLGVGREVSPGDSCFDGSLTAELGAQHYRAPEAWTSVYTSSCDIWSFAMVAVQLLRVQRNTEVPDRELSEVPNTSQICARLGVTETCSSFVSLMEDITLKNLQIVANHRWEEVNVLQNSPLALLEDCLNTCPEDRPSAQMVVRTLLDIISTQRVTLNRKDPDLVQPDATPHIQDWVFQEKLQKLNLFVVTGDVTALPKMLKRYPHLLLLKSTITDLSGRQFFLTPFQYAFWAQDFEMCEMILHFLGLPAAREQIHEIEQLSTDHGSSYDFQQLIRSLQHFGDHAPWMSKKDQKEYWQEVIGSHQRQCPAWVIFLMCQEGTDSVWWTASFTGDYLLLRKKKHLRWWFQTCCNPQLPKGSRTACLRGSLPSCQASADGHAWGNWGGVTTYLAVLEMLYVQDDAVHFKKLEEAQQLRREKLKEKINSQIEGHRG